MRSEPFLLVPESRRWPIVLISLHRHSTSSALGLSVWSGAHSCQFLRIAFLQNFCLVLICQHLVAQARVFDCL